MIPLPNGVTLNVDRHSDLPLGAQLAATLRAAVAAGRLGPGDRLPSVRELAAAAGVNVNTARAVYQRLEREGLVRSEQGRGTFVAPPGDQGNEAAQRRELRRQIARLEAELALRPPPHAAPIEEPSRAAGKLMTADELRDVRDQLLERLRALDTARAEVLRTLAELELAEEAERPEASAEPAPSPGTRRSTLSLPGARVRWVGA